MSPSDAAPEPLQWSQRMCFLIENYGRYVNNDKRRASGRTHVDISSVVPRKSELVMGRLLRVVTRTYLQERPGIPSVRFALGVLVVAVQLQRINEMNLRVLKNSHPPPKKLANISKGLACCCCPPSCARKPSCSPVTKDQYTLEVVQRCFHLAMPVIDLPFLL